jgi:hypothetical protein
LSSRKELEAYPGRITQDLSAFRDFVNQVCNGEIGPVCAKSLQVWIQKLDHLNDFRVRPAPAAKEIKISLDRLCRKASENVQEWLVQRVTDLCHHDGTGQFALHDIFLPSKHLLLFFKVNSPDVDLEKFKLLIRLVLQQMAPISVSNEIFVFISALKCFFLTKVVAFDV